MAEIYYSTFKSDIQHDFLLPNQDKQNKLLLSKLLHSRPVVPTVLENLDIWGSLILKVWFLALEK